jgi:hypothetical protein
MIRPARRLRPQLVAASLLCLLSVPALADELDDPAGHRVWFGVGLGGGEVKSLAPSPAADSSFVAGSIEVGYRLRPEWGIGLELGAIGPLAGCEEWDCGTTPESFAPNFSRLMAFGEYRPVDSGLRVRAGFGVSRFCYERSWNEDGWSPFDFVMALIDESYLIDGGSGSWRCDGTRHALGGSVSIGYDWRLARNAPLLMGVRLTAEGANYPATRSIGLPKFRHRAVMLTLQVQVN